MPWLTPETLPDIEVFQIAIPDNERLRAAFLGAFLDLCRAENWEQYGATTPDEVADLFFDCYSLSEPLDYVP